VRASPIYQAYKLSSAPTRAVPRKRTTNKGQLGLAMDLPTTEQMIALASDYGVRFTTALAIFVIGRWLIKHLVALIGKALILRAKDETLAHFLTAILRWLGLIFVVIVALSHVGVDTTSLVALLGAAGLAIGLSLQGSLGNFAAGAMLIAFKPFKKGDFVEVAGALGTVDGISIFTTTVITPDNKEIIIPNGNITGANITNFSARSTRRVDMVFSISYDDDIRKARQILEGIISNDSRVLAEPEPIVRLGELSDSSINFIVRPWVDSNDYWPVFWDTNEAVKLRFDQEGISIPFPQLDVHWHRTSN